MSSCGNVFLASVLIAMCGIMQTRAGEQDRTVRGKGSSMPGSYVPAPSFSAAKPVWPEGREKEWNCQVGFTAEFDGRDALVASNAVLRYTGATMCRVFLNGEFLGYAGR